MKGVPKYYWDSSIFIMLLGNQDCYGEGVLDSARQFVRMMESGQIVIVTSQITITEILPSKYPPDVYDRFESWLQRKNLQLRAVDHPVSRRAASIRDRCIQKKVRIETPDALHVATASLYLEQLEKIHSVDDDFLKAVTHSGETMKVERPFIPPPPELPPLTPQLELPTGVSQGVLQLEEITSEPPNLVPASVTSTAGKADEPSLSGDAARPHFTSASEGVSAGADGMSRPAEHPLPGPDGAGPLPIAAPNQPSTPAAGTGP